MPPTTPATPARLLGRQSLDVAQDNRVPPSAGSRASESSRTCSNSRDSAWASGRSSGESGTATMDPRDRDRDRRAAKHGVTGDAVPR